MRILITLLLFIHGIIHFMGIAKAYQLGNLAQFSREISKPVGVFWLLAGLLFLSSAVLYLLKKDAWPILAIIAVILSQILILMAWKDAKFGTVANVMVFLIGISASGHYQFDRMVEMESSQLLQTIKVKNLPFVSKETIGHLPEIVQKWILNSGSIDMEKIVSLRLRQKGEMKTTPKGKWMSFTATQYFDIENPGFVWSTEVDFFPVLSMVGRDKLIDGQGEMLIKLGALVPVVDEGNNEKINSGAMIRYMAEMVWFPSAVLNDYIKWETIDTNSAKAIFSLDGQEVSGIYTFSDKGNFESFEADRYYGGKSNSKLEKWKITVQSRKTFNGVLIPNKCSVTWKLNDGDFNWLNLEITALEFNINEPY